MESKMKIIWTRHAAERQKAWENRLGITRELVERVLENPEQVVEGYQGARIAQSRYRDGLLRVVFVEHGVERKVLTVYWTSKVGKYWEAKTG